MMLCFWLAVSLFVLIGWRLRRSGEVAGGNGLLLLAALFGGGGLFAAVAGGYAVVPGWLAVALAAGALVFFTQGVRRLTRRQTP